MNSTQTCAPSPERSPSRWPLWTPSEGEEQAHGGEASDDYITWSIDANVIYAIDADEPEGYGEPIAFCAMHDSSGPIGDPSPAPMAEGVLYVAMGAGITYTCDWFTVDLGGSTGGGDDSHGQPDR